LYEHAGASGVTTARGLTKINTELSNVASRAEMYEHGGIFSPTNQILNLDLLSGAIDTSKISGLIVLHAEEVTATSPAAFNIRLYRETNKTGFLKAFSDTPEAFTMGFAPLSRMMKNLFLQKASFWPRFQVDVVKSLEGKKQVEVIELAVPMSDSMIAIQQAIWGCVEICVRELKSANKELDIEDLVAETALHKEFDRIIQRKLSPFWHRVSPRSKQIAGDLTTLRELLL